MVTVHGELLETDPDIVTAYVARNIRTARWAKAHPAEATRYIASDSESAEEPVPFKYSPDVVNAREPSLGDNLLGYLEDQKDFPLREGLLRDDFAVSEFVARSPFDEAKRIVDLEEREAAA